VIARPLPCPGGLDPGIAEYVRVLLAQGVETFESCQGGPGHAYTEPVSTRILITRFPFSSAITAVERWHAREKFDVRHGELLVLRADDTGYCLQRTDARS
jgi:hypothetical protein